MPIIFSSERAGIQTLVEQKSDERMDIPEKPRLFGHYHPKVLAMQENSFSFVLVLLVKFRHRSTPSTLKLSTVHRPPSTVNRQPSTVHRKPSQWLKSTYSSLMRLQIKLQLSS